VGCNGLKNQVKISENKALRVLVAIVH